MTEIGSYADRVTIFYNERAWQRDEPCFDARCDSNALPAGSVVIGLLLGNRLGVVCPPYMNATQANNLGGVIRRAIDDLGLEGNDEEGPLNGGSATIVLAPRVQA